MAITDCRGPAELRAYVERTTKTITAALPEFVRLGGSLRELQDTEEFTGPYLPGANSFRHYCQRELLLDLDTVNSIIRLADTVAQTRLSWRRDIFGSHD